MDYLSIIVSYASTMTAIEKYEINEDDQMYYDGHALTKKALLGIVYCKEGWL